MPWSIFLNWRVLVFLALLALIGGAYYEYHSLESKLLEQQTALKQEQDNNVVLQNNVDTLQQVNRVNNQIMQQQQAQAADTAATINQLSSQLQVKTQSFVAVQTQLNAIKDKPVPLTNYLKSAINGIQTQRALLNPPTPASGASK